MSKQQNDQSDNQGANDNAQLANTGGANTDTTTNTAGDTTTQIENPGGTLAPNPGNNGTDQTVTQDGQAQGGDLTAKTDVINTIPTANTEGRTNTDTTTTNTGGDTTTQVVNPEGALAANPGNGTDQTITQDGQAQGDNPAANTGRNNDEIEKSPLETIDDLLNTAREDVNKLQQAILTVKDKVGDFVHDLSRIVGTILPNTGENALHTEGGLVGNNDQVQLAGDNNIATHPENAQ